jgi:hypothetical protein
MATKKTEELPFACVSECFVFSRVANVFILQSNEHVAVIAKIDLFKHMNNVQMLNIADKFEEKVLDAGQVICRQDDDMEYFIIVLNGK